MKKQPTTSARNKIGTFPYSGKTLPSKWEDAERWIFSPVSGDVAIQTSIQQAQIRPKSKSGPLGRPGVAYRQMFSPAVSMCTEGQGNDDVKPVANNSPFLDFIMGSNTSSLRYEGCEGSGNFIAGAEACIARSISIHGCSEVLSQTTTGQGDLDEKYNVSTYSVTRAVSRSDVATQMSPESERSDQSSHSMLSSPSFSLAAPSVLPVIEIRSKDSSKIDVLVDEEITMTRWSEKNRCKNTDDDWKRTATNIRSTTRWEVSTDSSRSISKEEAKITAWENLQKAKAEAAIRKLEMKLEKKRSSSMNKIANKLRAAQKKAQEMRSANQTCDRSSSEDERSSFQRTKGCFACPAF